MKQQRPPASIDLLQPTVSRMLNFLRAMVLLAAFQLTFSALAADSLDFTGRLGPIAPENILQEPGYYIWCGSGIRGEDGKCYLFYSRWQTGSQGRAPGDEKLFKDMSGWMKYSEIAAAVSDSPTAPFKHVATVLRSTGDTNRWDCFDAHNPHIRKFGKKIYLYYVANNLAQLFFNDDGNPVCINAAAAEQDPFKGTPSFNLAIPIRTLNSPSATP